MKEIKVGDVCRVHTVDGYGSLPVTEGSVVLVVMMNGAQTYRYNCDLLFGKRTRDPAHLNFDARELELIHEQENHRELPDDPNWVE